MLLLLKYELPFALTSAPEPFDGALPKYVKPYTQLLPPAVEIPLGKNAEFAVPQGFPLLTYPVGAFTK